MKTLAAPPSTFIQRLLYLGMSCLGLWLMGQAFCPPSTLALISDSSVYSYRRPSFDGIGKQYMGREIAEVMGHQGASWLERSDRTTEEQPQKMLAALHLAPTDTVAEIGAGTGYISLQAAALVPQGQVLAVDIQPEMITLLNSRIKSLRISNVTPILGTEQSPSLSPESIDLALMVDAYHEFNFPREMMTAIAQALKPTGRVALVEYRGEDPFVFIKPHHKMTQAQVRQEMEAVGLTWQETQALPQQHLMIFAKG